MSEEIINALTRIKNLRVVARTSSFSFKGKDIDLILGEQLKDVFVLPRVAVETDDKVLVITADKHIERRAVQVATRKGEQVIVSAGLTAGERISLTPMPFAHEGTAIAILGEQKKGDKKYPPLSSPSGH